MTKPTMSQFLNKDDLAAARSQDDEQHVMSEAYTPTPWAQSDQNPLAVFRDNLGVIDFDMPVALFWRAEDARFVIDVIDALEDLVAEHFAPEYGTGKHRAQLWETARAALARAKGAA